MDSTPGYPQDREHNGIRFTLIEAPRPDRARFRFAGPFQGQEIRWDATLIALANAGNRPALSVERSYIEIGPETRAGRAVTVGLAIPSVDLGTILRTIIMLRQYKRLHVGRHEFGGPNDPGPMPG